MKNTWLVPVFLTFWLSLSYAQDIGTGMALEEGVADQQSGRYVLLTVKGRSMQSTSVPAMILDTLQGIVWVARDIQDDRPAWVKTDLGQNAGQSLSGRKYVGSVIQWQEGNFKAPAMVVDSEKGIVWTCPDITANPGSWVQIDFDKVTQKEVRGAELRY